MIRVLSIPEEYERIIGHTATGRLGYVWNV
jgi:hypothetical protein